MKLGIDLDGVVYPFWADYNAWCISQGMITEADAEAAVKRISWHTDFGHSDEDFHEICCEAVDAGHMFLWGSPLPGAYEALWSHKNRGHTIHYITARQFGNKSEANTCEWLRREGFPMDTITFAHDKTVADVDVFLDDFVRNVDAMQAKGIESFLMYDPPRLDQLNHPRLVTGWKDFGIKVAAVESARMIWH